MHQTQWRNTLHQIFIYKSYTKWKKSTPNFYVKKVTLYSVRITSKTENFTPNNKTFTLNLVFLHQIRKNLEETLKCLHQIKSICTSNCMVSSAINDKFGEW